MRKTFLLLLLFPIFAHADVLSEAVMGADNDMERMPVTSIQAIVSAYDQPASYRKVRWLMIMRETNPMDAYDQKAAILDSINNSVQGYLNADMTGQANLEDGLVKTALISGRIYFDFNADQTEVGDVLNDFVKKTGTENSVLLIGHTDSIGSEKYNVDLGKRRADFIGSRFMADGVNNDQIHSLSLGKLNPIASNATAKGRAENRRVEIFVEPK